MSESLDTTVREVHGRLELMNDEFSDGWRGVVRDLLRDGWGARVTVPANRLSWTCMKICMLVATRHVFEEVQHAV